MRGGVPARGYQVERQDVGRLLSERNLPLAQRSAACLLYTSDAADERSSVDLGGRRIIKKKKRVGTHRIAVNHTHIKRASTLLRQESKKHERTLEQ